MSNSFYIKGKEKILSGSIDFSSDTIVVVLMKSAYVSDLSVDEFYSDISSDVLAGPITLSNKSITGGIFDADDVTFASVTTANLFNALVIYKDTGTAATSPLLLYLDDVENFPSTSDGSDVPIKWPDNTYKIFSL